MVIRHEAQYITEILHNGTYFTDFLLADLDGDGYYEIIVRHATDLFGDAGQQQSSIYKLEDEQLRKLSGFPYDDYFDTRFTLTILGLTRIFIYFKLWT